MVVAHERCQICGKVVDFLMNDGEVLLREAKCSHCGASLRNSDVAGEIIRSVSGEQTGLTNQQELLGKYKILNACSSGYIHNALKGLDSYTCSEFFDNVPVGEYYEGVLCVDLCNIPFSNNTFDIVITEDIFEHIANYETAMTEIYRVLKPGGCHIFTVPLHDGHKTESRKGKKEVYHGDPIHADTGCIVITDWGNDIKDIVEKYGYHVDIVRKHDFYASNEITVVDESYDEYLAKRKCLNTYLKYNSTVIKAYKDISANITSDNKIIYSVEQLEEILQDKEKKIVLFNKNIREKNDIIRELNDDNEQRGKHILNLDRQIEEKSVFIQELQKENKDRNDHIQKLDGELAKTESIIQDLRGENEDRNDHIKELDAELKKNGDIIRELQKENDERNRHVKELDNELKQKGDNLHELQRENEERNRHIQYLDSIITKNNKMFMDYRTEIEVKEQQLETQKQLNDTQLQQIVKQSERIVDQTEQLLKLSEDVDQYVQQSIKKSEQIEKQNEENANQRKIIEQQSNDILDYQQKITKLEQTAKSERSDYEQRITELEQTAKSERSDYEQRITKLEQTAKNERSDYEQRITKLEQTASNERNEYEQRFTELRQTTQKEQDCYEQKFADLEQSVQKEREEYGQKIAKLEQVIKNKEGHIEQLLEVERAYEREKKTHSYRFGKRLQKFGNALLPINSQRRFFARVLFNIFRHPIVMFKVIRPARIKRYIKYTRQGDMEGIKRGFGEAIRTEKMNINGNKVSEVSIMPVAEQDSQELKAEDFDKIAFQTFRKPTVSIVIPVYNEFNYTYNCLISILKNSGDVTYEVIIANDCSVDLTKNISDIVSGIKVVTTKKNMRFLLNCNNAAKHAKGKYIVFLNNDTQVQENWLQPFVQLMESDAQIGLAGSKLIYPDGYLQEAGGIVWRDGSAWNYGNRKNPDDPEYNYVKEADYISGAAIMIRKSLWNEIGGFDERFVPAYCEDSDLAFSVRAHGYKVMYQPLSVVVHFEGVSNGTDLSSGQKAYQIENQRKLVEKWKDVLDREHFVNAQHVFVARDRNRHKPVLLMVDHYVPQYDKDAGSRTVFQYLKLFVAKGYNVKFIGDNFYRHEPYTTTLQQMGIEVLYGPYYAQNWKEWIKENGAYIQYAFLNRPHISVNYIDFIRENTKAKIIYYGHDLHFLREMRKYELTHDKQALIDSNDWREKEISLMKKADVVYYPSNVEINEIRKIDKDINAKAITAYIFQHIESKTYQFEKRKDIMFVGGFTHTPNVDAVIWFGKAVMPIIVDKLPDIKWYVMGSNPPQEIMEMASEHIIIKGFVSDEDLENYYAQCRMSIVPLRYGAGIKGKVVEAMRYGMPVITTSVGAEGIMDAEDILCVADDENGLAEKIIALYNDKEYLKQRSAKSYEYIKNYFSQENAWNIIKTDFI